MGETVVYVYFLLSVTSPCCSLGVIYKLFIGLILLLHLGDYHFCFPCKYLRYRFYNLVLMQGCYWRWNFDFWSNSFTIWAARSKNCWNKASYFRAANTYCFFIYPFLKANQLNKIVNHLFIKVYTTINGEKILVRSIKPFFTFDEYYLKPFR